MTSSCLEDGAPKRKASNYVCPFTPSLDLTAARNNLIQPFPFLFPSAYVPQSIRYRFARWSLQELGSYLVVGTWVCWSKAVAFSEAKGLNELVLCKFEAGFFLEQLLWRKV